MYATKMQRHLHNQGLYVIAQLCVYFSTDRNDVPNCSKKARYMDQTSMDIHTPHSLAEI